MNLEKKITNTPDPKKETGSTKIVLFKLCLILLFDFAGNEILGPQKMGKESMNLGKILKKKRALQK